MCALILKSIKFKTSIFLDTSTSAVYFENFVSRSNRELKPCQKFSHLIRILTFDKFDKILQVSTFLEDSMGLGAALSPIKMSTESSRNFEICQKSIAVELYCYEKRNQNQIRDEQILFLMDSSNGIDLGQ